MITEFLKRIMEDLKKDNIPKPRILDEFLLLKKMKSTSTSSIYYASGDSGEYFICKVYPKNIMIGKDSLKKYVDSEIEITKMLEHPYIIPIETTHEDSNNIYIFTEFKRMGTMTDYISEHGPFKEDDAKFIFYKLLDTVLYIHLNHVVHLDLKCDNILIDYDYHGIGLRPIIIDFGCSVIVDESYKVEGARGTPLYMSPECIDDNSFDGRCADVWDCGFILYHMLTGHVPFKEPSNFEDLKKMIKEKPIKFPYNFPTDAKSLIEAMTEKDYKKRITIEDAMTHDYFTK